MDKSKVIEGIRRNALSEEEAEWAIKNFLQSEKEYEEYMAREKRIKKKERYYPNKETDFFTQPILSYQDDIKMEENKFMDTRRKK